MLRTPNMSSALSAAWPGSVRSPPSLLIMERPAPALAFCLQHCYLPRMDKDTPSRRPLAAGRRDRTSPQRVQRTSLEQKALALRRAGHTLDEVAHMMGGHMTESKVQYMITKVLRDTVADDASTVRRQMMDQLDRLLNRAIRIANTESSDRVGAINAAVNAAARIAALTGADAPRQVDLRDDRQHTPDEAARKKFLERLAAEAGREKSGAG